ncbi:MAG: HAD family phosphatase [Chlamydiota bacterium]
MKKIKTIYFDLGNVLIFFSFPKMFSQIKILSGLEQSEIEHLFFQKQLRELYETGKIDTAEIYRQFQCKAPLSFSLPDFRKALSDIFTPNQELVPLIESLKNQGIRLILLSNTCDCHFDHLYSHYPVLQLFDYKILSFEVGACKPDPLIFQKALEMSQCSLEECFYTDDIPEFIAGAKNCGLDGEIFTDVPALRRQLISRGCAL